MAPMVFNVVKKVYYFFLCEKNVGSGTFDIENNGFLGGLDSSRRVSFPPGRLHYLIFGFAYEYNVNVTKKSFEVGAYSDL